MPESALRQGRPSIAVPLVVAAVAVGALAWVGGATAGVFSGLLVGVALVAAAAMGQVRSRRASAPGPFGAGQSGASQTRNREAQNRKPENPPRKVQPDPKVVAQERWHRANETYAAVMQEYGSWELDPEMLLKFPALWNRSHSENRAFFEAMEEVSHRRTRDIPGRADAPDIAAIDAYAAAVDEFEHAWQVAEQNARRLGIDDVPTSLRPDVERSLKLVRHADRATTEAEKAAYLGQAATIMTRLADRGVLPAKSPAMASLEQRRQQALEPGES